MYEVNRDGKALNNLSGDTEVFSSSVTWSPDGRHIAFVNTRSGNNTGDVNPIYLMQADGSGLRKLTDKLGAYSDISWSPDSQSIVFSGLLYGNSERGSFEIFTLRIDGTQMLNISNDSANDLSPSWQPYSKYPR
jgi:TolB protein